MNEWYTFEDAEKIIDDVFGELQQRSVEQIVALRDHLNSAFQKGQQIGNEATNN